MVVLMWPAIFSMSAQIGLPQAYRYWTAKKPERVSGLYSNAIIFTLVVGILTLVIAELTIPHLIGSRSPEVLRFARISTGDSGANADRSDSQPARGRAPL